MGMLKEGFPETGTSYVRVSGGNQVGGQKG